MPSWNLNLAITESSNSRSEVRKSDELRNSDKIDANRMCTSNPVDRAVHLIIRADAELETGGL
jgi:hypothetical protein